MTLLTLVSILTAQVSGLAPAAAQRGDPMPDLAAMLLRTSDLADAGYDDQFFPYGGTCLTPEQEAKSLGESRDLDPANVLEFLTDVGWQRTCGASYAVPEAGGTPDAPAPPTFGITSYVHLYGDADGAEEGFAFFEDESGNPDAEDLAGGTDLGDQSEATLTSGSDNSGEYLSLDLAVQVDNLIIGVTIRDYTGETPELGSVEALMEILEDRVDMVLEGESPGLGAMVLRMEGEGLPKTGANRYLVMDGQGDQNITETEEDFERRMSGYLRAEAVYTATQTIPAGSEDNNTDDYLFGVNLYQFRSERAASRYLQAAPQRYGEDPDVFDVVVHEDAPQYGDESLALGHGQTLNSGQPVINDRILVRVGDIVINAGFRGAMIPIGIAEEIIEAQIACVEAGYCTTTVPVPAALTGETAQTTPAETPDPAGKTATGLRPSDAATYTSELYPYTLSYSEDWTLEEPQVLGDAEILSLSNGQSGVVIIMDTAHEGDVSSCLDGALAYIEDDPEVEDIEPIEDANGDPVEGMDDETAFAAYSYVPADGGEMALYVECRVIVPGEVTMEFNQFIALEDYESELDARTDLLEGLVIGD
jgi:hypothetical protein